MTDIEDTAEMRVLLVGGDAALLEGLAQSFAALGYATRVAGTLRDARESAAAEPPLLAVVDRLIAGAAAGEAFAIPLAAGGALVLYHTTDDDRTVIAPAIQRIVMAELALPLERNRLMALAQHVSERVRATGRTHRRTPPEQSAF